MEEQRKRQIYIRNHRMIAKEKPCGETQRLSPVMRSTAKARCSGALFSYGMAVNREAEARKSKELNEKR